MGLQRLVAAPLHALIPKPQGHEAQGVQDPAERRILLLRVELGIKKSPCAPKTPKNVGKKIVSVTGATTTATSKRKRQDAQGIGRNIHGKVYPNLSETGQTEIGITE